MNINEIQNTDKKQKLNFSREKNAIELIAAVGTNV